MKLQWWGQLLMPKIVTVFERSSGSSKVKWGQKGKHWLVDMKLGGRGQLLMMKILNVTARSSGHPRSNGVNVGWSTWNLVCAVNCWCRKFEVHFKVIRGHLRSNGINIGWLTWNLVGGVNYWCRKFWRSVQGHQGSSKVIWGQIG